MSDPQALAEAYRAGEEAHAMRIPREWNPYPAGLEAGMWEAGWDRMEEVPPFETEEEWGARIERERLRKRREAGFQDLVTRAQARVELLADFLALPYCPADILGDQRRMVREVVDELLSREPLPLETAAQSTTRGDPMSKQIAAKFTCQSVTRYGGGYEQVEFSAVSREGGENKQWAEATPFGKLEMTIDNPDAHGAFEPGKDYLLTISEAD